jgi:hypothetical protein
VVFFLRARAKNRTINERRKGTRAVPESSAFELRIVIKRLKSYTLQILMKFRQN